MNPRVSRSNISAFASDALEVSVIVRTFNEAKHLPRLLDCLERPAEIRQENLDVESIINLISK